MVRVHGGMMRIRPLTFTIDPITIDPITIAGTTSITTAVPGFTPGIGAIAGAARYLG